MSSGATDPIEFRNVWKIFGNRDREAMQAIQSEGLSKAEVLERYNCAIGLADVTLAIRQGEIFCVMGLSGSGKSTLVRQINRLIGPTAGRVLVQGQDINRLPIEALRKMRAERIGMVFQNFALLPHRTVRENVALPLELRGATRNDRWNLARDALSVVQLSGWEEAYPHQLSGGMRQRVGLARALAANPDILLMDEPFSALDPLIRRQLQDEFLKLAKIMKKTTVFITHDLDEAIHLGDRIAIMKDGSIVQVGTPREIVESPANDYVARFVEGIPRLSFIRAGAVVDRLAPMPSARDLDSAPRVRSDATLLELVELAADSDAPIVITDDADKTTGIVTKRSLLRGIVGEHKAAVSTGANAAEIRDDAKARPPEPFDKLVADFVGPGAGYYQRVFRRFATSNLPISGFNWAAALLGPVWAAGRGLWALFAAALVGETIAAVQIGRGLWSNLGQEDLDHAESLRQRAAEFAAKADEAFKAGQENAAALKKMADNLAAGVQESMAHYEIAVAAATHILVVGVGLLLVVKLAEGIIANWVVARRLNLWRSNRQIAHGLSPARTVVGIFIGVVTLLFALFGYTLSDAPKQYPYLFEFPAYYGFSSMLGKSIDNAIDWISVNGSEVFAAISFAIRIVLDAMEIALVVTPWPLVAFAIVLASWYLTGLRFTIFTAAALLYLGMFGYWKTSMETVALLGTAAVIATALGVPLGIYFGRNQRAYAIARPVLDFAQTMPAFVYLIPVIALFGIGKPPAIIATLIFGMPPVIRLTALGLQQVPHDLKEAGIAFGANDRQLLTKIELPLSKPSIMAGINQTTLMCLAMVVIASLIGAKGLGQQVLESLQYANKGAGILSGLAILFCAMILDRIVQSRRN